jgi:putative addiction module antidote
MTDETKRKGVAEVAQRFEAIANRTLKLRRIGNSLGVVLPKELLAKLNVGEGDQLIVSETPEGLVLKATNDDMADLMKLAENIMAKRRRVLKALAK